MGIKINVMDTFFQSTRSLLISGNFCLMSFECAETYPLGEASYALSQLEGAADVETACEIMLKLWGRREIT